MTRMDNADPMFAEASVAPASPQVKVMLRWAGYTMIAIGLLHIAVLGMDALPLLGGWASGVLWTTDHWQPVASQAHDMVVNNAAFHATVGSFAGPVIVFGAVVLWMDRRDVTPPAFLGWGLGVWALLASLIMEPSGYPLGLIPAMLLILAARRGVAST